VLSVEEGGRLLEPAPGIQYKAVLGAAFGAGLQAWYQAAQVLRSDTVLVV
jgi:hypothetical protein